MPGIAGTMKEYSAGTLKSSSGQKVTNRKQAIAIGLSEERRGEGPATKSAVSRNIANSAKRVK